MKKGHYRNGHIRKVFMNLERRPPKEVTRLLALIEENAPPQT